MGKSDPDENKKGPRWETAQMGDHQHGRAPSRPIWALSHLGLMGTRMED